MRLLDAATCTFRSFVDDEIPPYAILSHRWGEAEVTLQDLESGNTHGKAGYKKVTMTCSIASAAGIGYVWINTCCIDKTSSAELSEAINSMYHWYQDATMCYAYLADVPPGMANPPVLDEDKLRYELPAPLYDSFHIAKDSFRSEWFTRGWTLQELIAPSALVFLDQTWGEIGSKLTLSLQISRITYIPEVILRGGDLSLACVAEKMSWASRRETTRVEDKAYCLMGLFGVNMPLLYGEGENAFLRLQEEILRISDDYSIFACMYDLSTSGSLLATSPAAFAGADWIAQADIAGIKHEPITIDNQGIHLTLRIRDMRKTGTYYQGYDYEVFLPCMMKKEDNSVVAIALNRDTMTKGFYKRKPDIKHYYMHKSPWILDLPYTKISVRQQRQRIRVPVLSRLAASGQVAGLRLLFELGVGPEFRDDRCQAALLQAAVHEKSQAVEVILEKGFAPDEREDWLVKTMCSWSWLTEPGPGFNERREKARKVVPTIISALTPESRSRVCRRVMEAKDGINQYYFAKLIPSEEDLEGSTSGH